MQIPEHKNKPYFIVASVEMGNTTTKCILTGVSLETGMSYVINKTVSMSRDIRPPKPGETIFGATLDGTELTREAVTELVRDTLLQCHKDAHLDVLKDLDFVVRSTGVVAEMESPDQIGDFVIALRTFDVDPRIAGNFVIERARYEATISPKDGNAVVREAGKHVVVFRRQTDGSWKVFWEIWNSDR